MRDWSLNQRFLKHVGHQTASTTEFWVLMQFDFATFAITFATSAVICPFTAKDAKNSAKDAKNILLTTQTASIPNFDKSCNNATFTVKGLGVVVWSCQSDFQEARFDTAVITPQTRNQIELATILFHYQGRRTIALHTLGRF